MSKFLQKYWWLILIIVILIILIVRAKNKPNSELNNIQNGLTGIVNNTVTSISSPSNPTVEPKTSGFGIGDKIYSRSLTNTYKSPSATAGNLDSYKSFQKDEFIGTYLSTEGIWTKLLIASPAHSVYVLTNQIYSK